MPFWSGLLLFVSLALPRFPVVGHSPTGSFSQMSNDIVIVHSHCVLDSRLSAGVGPR